MKERVASGCIVGTFVSVLCWNGNRSPGLVSTFPDGLTLAALFLALMTMLWFQGRRLPLSAPGPLWRIGAEMGASAGVLLGTTVAILGMVRFADPSALLLFFGFASALASSVVLGITAGALLFGLRSTRTT